jgi:4,5-DOPA dioxygenase extradiol
MPARDDRPDVLDRRTVLAGGAGLALSALGQRALADDAAPPPRVPVAYVGHGSPMLALDAARGSAFTALGSAIGRPRAVLVVSAHFERAPATIGATRTVPLVYDFRGFPQALYQVRYPAPGAPRLARRVGEVLAPLGGVTRAEDRGHDHGAWVPLRWLYPDADVPVLSLSLPTHAPQALFRLGRALRPLRDEGVLILASGNLTHNLRRVDPRPDAPVPAWAHDFDAWAVGVLVRHDVGALLGWERAAPAARTNHPTVEHFVPLLVAAGAAHDDEAVTFPITGFEAGSLSRRSVAWGLARGA